jgi:6-pyruvoyltetrahydropterin/6-carboxytetrahydropterin synthase
MTAPTFEITKAASFDAAHYLGHPGAEDRYRRLHGHSFRVEASVRGPADGEAGWVEDFAALEDALRAVAAELDHGLLNEHPGLETPTLERLCLHFAARLKPRFSGLSRIVVERPTVGERCALNLSPEPVAG